MHQFRALLGLIDTNPAAYCSEISRMRRDEPERFTLFLERMRAQIAREGWSRPRRLSSLAAIATGDVAALLAKHQRKLTSGE